MVSGADFYSSPCFSPDGTHLVWQQWCHPDMPWEGGELHVADVVLDANALRLSNTRHIAGRMYAISASYPTWVSNDLILFTSDTSGYQNPWTYSITTGKVSPVLPTPLELDFSLPAWRPSFQFSAVLCSKQITALFVVTKGGRSVLFLVNLTSGAFEEIRCPYVDVAQLTRVTHNAVVFIGKMSKAPTNIILCSFKDTAYSKPVFAAIKPSAQADASLAALDPYVSVAQPITLTVPPNDEPLHVVYFPPSNPEFVGLETERPPCVVNAHGGPTLHASQALSWTTQYFTSRGWAW